MEYSPGEIKVINDQVRLFKQDVERVRRWILLEEKECNDIFEKLTDMDSLHQYDGDYWPLCREVDDKLLSLYTWGVLEEKFQGLFTEGKTHDELADGLWIAKKITRIIDGARDVIRKMKYFENTKKEEIDCPICMQVLEIAKVTPCSHSFHSLCLFKCLIRPCASSGLCPMCRSVLLKSPSMEDTN